MESLFNLLHQGLSFIVPFIVLLGVLIFVHEFGHFSVAKFFGVRVEVFSLGFGRKILKKKWGDTTYCISAVPFGGYVKMFGDDPSVAVPTNQKKYSFNHQPVIPRIAIVLAGPAMNAFFAFVLFTAIAGIGEEVMRPVLGDIYSDTAAYKAGLRTGDVVEKINGVDVDRWDHLKKQIEDSHSGNVAFSLKRNSQPLTINAKAEPTANKNILSLQSTVGEIDGLSAMSRASVIGVSNPLSVAWTAGLRTGDIIHKVDNRDVSRWTEFEEALKASTTQGRFANLEVERPETSKTLKITLPISKKDPLSGIEPSDLFLSQVMPNSAAHDAGVQANDRLVTIQGAKLARWDDVVKAVQSYKEGQGPLKIEYLRDGKKHLTEITPKLITQTDNNGVEHKNYALGVVTGLLFAQPETFIAREKSIPAMFVRGFGETIQWTKLTAMSFVRLVEQKVSAKNIGGVLMIGKLAGETWKIGISPFLKIMAIISINLFLLNLLPVPVLDGGHLLFFTIEFVKGSPLSFRKLEIMQQVGMFLLLALMVFSLYNDLIRLFSS